MTVPLEEGGSTRGHPVAGGAVGIAQLDRAADVVERAKHAGDVAQCEVGPDPLVQRAERLALEVDGDPAVGRTQHLAEVVVAVDALQVGPRAGAEVVERGGDDRLVGGQAGTSATAVS